MNSSGLSKRDQSRANRTSLFGDRDGAGSQQRVYAAQSQELLERDNDAIIDNLASKVSTIKEVSILIGDEVKASNALLDGLQEDMSRAQGLLGSTIKRLDKLIASGGGRHMCYLVLFMIGVFFVLYWWARNPK